MICSNFGITHARGHTIERFLDPRQSTPDNCRHRWNPGLVPRYPFQKPPSKGLGARGEERRSEGRRGLHLRKAFKGASRSLQGGFKKASRGLEGSLKGASPSEGFKGLEGGLKGA